MKPPPLPLLRLAEPRHHEYPPMLGPLEAVSAGSPEWAERLGLRIKHGVERVEKEGIGRLVPLIEMALNTLPAPWQIWPPDRPCLTPDGYFKYAAHIECASLAKLVAAYKGEDHSLVRRLQRAQADGETKIAGQNTGGRGKLRGDSPRLGRGKTRSHLLRRLSRKRPDLLAAYERGDFKTPTAAARAAGFKVDPSTLEVLRRAWKRASDDERRIFRAEICDARDPR